MFRLFIILSLLFESADSFALNQDIMADYVKIELDVKKSRKIEDKSYFKAWKTACTELGKNLLVGQGPWGFGAFSSYGCFRGKSKVSGSKKTSPWVLSVIDGEKDISFTLYFQGSEQTNVKIPSAQTFFEFMKDGEFVDSIAYSILDGLPMGMQVQKAMISGNPAVYSGRHWRAGRAKDFKFKVPQPPDEVVLYRLSWDSANKSWQSTVVGEAKRVKIVPPAEVRVKKKKVLKGGQVIYQVGPEVVEALGQGPLWAQSVDGPGLRSTELNSDLVRNTARMNSASEAGYLQEYLDGKAGILDQILRSTASGYIGMRYGLQVLPGEGSLGDLLNKTGVFSLLLEIRGGPLKGLRYYYDKLSEKKLSLKGSNDAEFEAKIAFARHVVGYSFGFDPGLLVNRVTLDPKLGMWAFDATLPVLQDTDGKVAQVQRFALGKTFSLALEVGLERSSNWFTLRGWYAIDTGFSLLKSGGKVTSNRLGIDTYFNAGPKFSLLGLNMKTALLGFYVYENVNISQGKSADLDPGVKEISGLTYSAGYAGGGVALSW